uniref:Large ribosomal subunit protein uL22c n=1 Tax=Porphyridium purpureum TaxID=35688 RepID=W0RYG7_PORPP|nr:chloroplast 50S ribosomal protein L22 [Porphyridium purpureum]ATJ02897.1 50S ribosomal protein L22 [Porphyridium purpureum]BAO23674.1 chloroplast 50S ribosomal protein L22 [Porphyridium purpureum]
MTNINQEELEVKAIRRYVRMSPQKVRRVLDQIRGQQYEKALMLLEFMPYRACKDILETVKSASANAEHNHGLNKEDLYITKAYADKGPVMKRFQPRAQGRAYKILKPTCHINISVGIKI